MWHEMCFLLVRGNKFQSKCSLPWRRLQGNPGSRHAIQGRPPMEGTREIIVEGRAEDVGILQALRFTAC